MCINGTARGLGLNPLAALFPASNLLNFPASDLPTFPSSHHLSFAICIGLSMSPPENGGSSTFSLAPLGTADLFESFSVYIVKQLGIRDSATQDFADIFNVFDVDN